MECADIEAGGVILEKKLAALPDHMQTDLMVDWYRSATCHSRLRLGRTSGSAGLRQEVPDIRQENPYPAQPYLKVACLARGAPWYIVPAPMRLAWKRAFTLAKNPSDVSFS